MAKKIGVAYVPTSESSAIIPQIEKVDNQDLVNYKESGVEYQGYSKIKISGNQYKLNLQERKNFAAHFSWVASNSDLSLGINPNAEVSDFFITSINLQYFSDIDCYFRVHDNIGAVLCRVLSQAGSTQRDFTITFNPPFRYTRDALFIQPFNYAGVGVAITGRVFLNLVGFTEQKR